MPIYEYQCGDCKSQFEILVRGSETPACPDCTSPNLTKQLSIASAPKTSGGGSLPMAAPHPNMGAG